MCNKVKKKLSVKWKKYFRSTITYEIEFLNTLPYCSFELILTIIQNYDSVTNIKNINQLKQILIDEYNSLAENNLQLLIYGVYRAKKNLLQK